MRAGTLYPFFFSWNTSARALFLIEITWEITSFCDAVIPNYFSRSVDFGAAKAEWFIFLPKQIYFLSSSFRRSGNCFFFATQEWEHQLLTPAFIFCFSEARVCMFVSVSRETESLDCESLWVKSAGYCTLLAQIESFRTESLSLCTHANGDIWWFPRKRAPIWPGRKKSLHRSPLVGFILAVPAALRWHSADTCLCFLKHLLKGAKPLNLAPLEQCCFQDPKKAFISSAQDFLRHKPSAGLATV